MIEFTCRNCRTPTVLTDAEKAPASKLCPPCEFWGLDWEDHPALVDIVEAMQRRHEAN